MQTSRPLIQNIIKFSKLATSSLLVVAILTLITLTETGCKPKESPEQKFSRLVTEAKSFKEKGKLEEARISLQNAIDINPNDATAYYDLAEVLTEAKQFSKALPTYQTALNLNPDYKEARMRIATFLVAGGEYEQAESHIAKLLEKDSNDVDAILLSASIDSIKKKFQDAKDKLNTVLKLSPDNAVALATLADIEQRQGNIQTAEEYFKKALAKDPSSEPIRVALADLYSRAGRFKDAEDLVSAVLNDNPKNSTLRFYFGDFLLERGLVERAISQYQQVLSYDPLRNDARDRLFDNYLGRGEQDKAKKLLEEFLTKYPKEPAADYFRGRLAQLDKKYDEALQYYIKSMASMGSFAPAFRHAGLTELSMGKTTEGIEHLNQAVTIDPFDIGARLALARDAFFKRDFTQASEHINKILSRHPRQIGANIVRADLALIQGDLKTAESIYKILLETFPNSPAPLFKLALLSEKADKKQEAMDYYRKAIAFDQDPYISINRLARLLVITSGFDAAIGELKQLRDKSTKAKAEFDVVLGFLYQGKPQKTQEDANMARSLFEEALQANEKFMPAYFALAGLDQASGNLAGAIEHYKKVIENQPQHIPSLMLLALTYEAQKQYPQAAEVYKQILAFAANFAPAANNLAWLYVEQLNQSLDDALKLAQSAKQEMPNDASITDTLGWIYYKQGSARAALSTLEEAVQLDTSAGQQNPEILYHLAVVQNALDNKQEALETIEKALKLATPDNPKRGEMEQLQSTLSSNKK